MPGFDGTGPNGQGAFTGGGRGYCAVNFNNGQYPTGRRFLRRGFGRGMGRGFAGGMGRGFGFSNANFNLGVQANYNVTPQQEAESLKMEAQAVQQELDAIHNRIKELESGK